MAGNKRIPPADNTAGGLTPAPSSPEPARHGARARVLVVDDDPGTREFVRGFLDEEGYDCIVARDGAEALATIMQRRPVLVLLDLNMPVMSGWELHAHLHAVEIGIPVIFMSAIDTVRTEATQHGAAGWLMKPFDLPELLRLVERFSARGP